MHQLMTADKAKDDLNEPAWVKMEEGLWWWGDWSIEEVDEEFFLTVSSKHIYGPFKTFHSANEKAWGVRG